MCRARERWERSHASTSTLLCSNLFQSFHYCDAVKVRHTFCEQEAKVLQNSITYSEYVFIILYRISILLTYLHTLYISFCLSLSKLDTSYV